METILKIDEFWKRRGFHLFVIVPTLAVLLYLSFLAKPLYMSETKWLVRENRESSGSLIPGFASGLFDLGSQTSMEDALILADYLHSAELIGKLDAELDLRTHYESPSLDVFRRLGESVGRERFIKYFQKRIQVSIAPDSSILTLSVSSFDPVFSLKLAEKLIELSEDKINVLNDRIVDSQTATATAELERAQEELVKARADLLAFQMKHSIIDPGSQAAAQFSNIASLDRQIMEVQAELRTKQQYLREGSNELRQLEQTLKALGEQREQETRRLVSVGDSSIASVLYNYERIRMENEFALNAYTATFALVEQAKLSAARQEKFILMIATPQLPDEPDSPRIFRDTLTTFVVLSLLFAIGRMILATIRDHTI